jgi:hypothetical protein
MVLSSFILLNQHMNFETHMTGNVLGTYNEKILTHSVLTYKPSQEVWWDAKFIKETCK